MADNTTSPDSEIPPLQIRALEDVWIHLPLVNWSASAGRVLRIFTTLSSNALGSSFASVEHAMWETRPLWVELIGIFTTNPTTRPLVGPLVEIFHEHESIVRSLWAEGIMWQTQGLDTRQIVGRVADRLKAVLMSAVGISEGTHRYEVMMEHFNLPLPPGILFARSMQHEPVATVAVTDYFELANDEPPEDPDCVICHEPFERRVKLKATCGHSRFCEECLAGWLSQLQLNRVRLTCLLCRDNFN